jgi:hypothetical protein
MTQTKTGMIDGGIVSISRSVIAILRSKEPACRQAGQSIIFIQYNKYMQINCEKLTKSLQEIAETIAGDDFSNSLKLEEMKNKKMRAGEVIKGLQKHENVINEKYVDFEKYEILENIKLETEQLAQLEQLRYDKENDQYIGYRNHGSTSTIERYSKTGKFISSMAYDNKLSNFEISPDSKYLVCSEGSELIILDATNKAEPMEVKKIDFKVNPGWNYIHDYWISNDNLVYLTVSHYDRERKTIMFAGKFHRLDLKNNFNLTEHQLPEALEVASFGIIPQARNQFFCHEASRSKTNAKLCTTITIFDLDHILKEIALDYEAYLSTFTPRGKYFISDELGYENSLIRITDTDSGKVVKEISTPKSAIEPGCGRGRLIVLPDLSIVFFTPTIYGGRVVRIGRKKE